jgi:hypothetical protein
LRPVPAPLLARTLSLTVERLRGLKHKIRKPAPVANAPVMQPAPAQVSITAQAPLAVVSIVVDEPQLSGEVVAGAPAVRPARLPWHRAVARWLVARAGVLRIKRA